jgi:hypothetical protein
MPDEKMTLVERGGGGTAIAIVAGIIALLAGLYVISARTSSAARLRRSMLM